MKTGADVLSSPATRPTISGHRLPAARRTRHAGSGPICHCPACGRSAPSAAASTSSPSRRASSASGVPTAATPDGPAAHAPQFVEDVPREAMQMDGELLHHQQRRPRQRAVGDRRHRARNRLVADVAPGAASSSPGSLTVAGGVSTSRPTTERTASSSGGATAPPRARGWCTTPPGAASSFPQRLTVAGSIYFSADDRAVGGGAVGARPRRRAGTLRTLRHHAVPSGGRFRVTADWRDSRAEPAPATPWRSPATPGTSGSSATPISK